MPIVFIHGVNTRIDDGYHRQLQDRRGLIEDLLKPQLPEPFSKMEVVDPYWGDLGGATGSSVLVPRHTGGSAERFGGAATAEGSSAHESLEEIVDTLLGVWGSQDEVSAGPNGNVGLVAQLLWDLRSDENVRQQVNGRTREEALNIIDETLRDRLKSENPQKSSAESFGIRSRMASVSNAVTELFGHPYVRRPVSTVLGSRRNGLHNRFALFLSDIFVYLKERGDSQSPGPIITEVLRAFTKDEPTLVVTHSMGGNIFYDVITHFAPKLRVDAWVSVGGQVAFFEYQRLFLQSVKGRFTGQKIAKPIAAPWLNIFDPIDPFAFLAEPVFHGVEDYEFVTGSSILNAHSDYFIRREFYNRAGARLGELLKEGFK